MTRRCVLYCVMRYRLFHLFESLSLSCFLFYFFLFHFKFPMVIIFVIFFSPHVRIASNNNKNNCDDGLAFRILIGFSIWCSIAIYSNWCQTMTTSCQTHLRFPNCGGDFNFMQINISGMEMKIEQGWGLPLVVECFHYFYFRWRLWFRKANFICCIFMIKSSECDPILLYCRYNGWSICEGDNVRLPNLRKK